MGLWNLVGMGIQSKERRNWVHTGEKGNWGNEWDKNICNLKCKVALFGLVGFELLPKNSSSGRRSSVQESTNKLKAK